MEAWLDSLATMLIIEPAIYLSEFLQSTSFLGSIDTWTPWVLEEIYGIAEGACLPFETLLAYNLADEEWCYRQRIAAGGDPLGCSVVGLRRPRSGAPIAAQNLDVPAHYAGTQILYTISEPESETTMAAYAGSTGICGCNEAAVSICCNALLTVSNSPRGLPVNCVVRGVLAQRTLAAARDFVESVPHDSGQAYLIGGRDGLVGLECSASGCREYGQGEDHLWHTNHPTVAPEAAEPLKGPAFGNTIRRGDFLAKHAPSARDGREVEALLSDRTVPICLVPEQARDSITFSSIVMELTVPPRLRLASGPPDRTPYEAV